MKDRLRTALVGYGYWGTNLLRNIACHPNCELVGFCEPKEPRRKIASEIYPKVPAFADFNEMLTSCRPDAVVVATPPAAHASVTLAALNFGAHVLVEKPLAISTRECESMVKAAGQRGKTLMVDSTLLFYPPSAHLLSIIKQGELGKILYFDSIRTNLGGIQPQANVLWDLAPHDIAIMDEIMNGQLPEKVVATGVKHFGSDTETLCYLNLLYPGGVNAHIQMNWTSPIKMRRITIGGDKKMAVFDDDLLTEKLKIYDKTVLPNFKYHSGATLSPALPQKEALSEVLTEFTQAIFENRPPISDGVSASRVVQILEAASRSLESGGVPQSLSSGALSRAA